MSRFLWSAVVIAVLLGGAYAGELVDKTIRNPNIIPTPPATPPKSSDAPFRTSFSPLVFPPVELPGTQATSSINAETLATSTAFTAPKKTGPAKSSPVVPTKNTTPTATTSPKDTAQATSSPETSQAEDVAPVLPSSGEATLDAAASTLRDALVNIVCYAPQGSTLHSISGSGIIIDPKGIILTNAHVAQYFLLKNMSVSCTIRAGSPAKDMYFARLIYISPAWITKNANVLTEATPEGTGEDDFAFLGIVGSASSTALPTTFPSITLSKDAPIATTPIVIASFGAQFLTTTQIESALFPTIVFGSVKKVFTFETNTIDVVDLGGSAAAQEGSSGGGIATAAGTLAGTITTSTIEGSTDTRSLSAITAPYIEREYENETGSSLTTLLAKPVLVSISDFAPKVPGLEATITAGLAQ